MGTGPICLSTVSYPPSTGGVATFTARFARLLARHGHDVHVLVPVQRAGARDELVTMDEDDVHVHRVWQDAPESPTAAFGLRQALAQIDARERFGLFHGVFLTAAHPCVIVAGHRTPPAPVIASIRGSDVSWLLEQPLARAAILPVLKKATCITSVNALYLERIAEEVDVAGRTLIVRNSAPPLADPPWTPVHARRGLVGTVGDFRRVKDIPLLVRAYLGLERPVRGGLWLAGSFSDPEEAAWVETLVAEAGAWSEVTITGMLPRADVLRGLRDLHVYVQSSAAEGLPNAVLEAAATGVPIVATAVGGMAEVLEDGVSALLVPHGDPGAMQTAIGRILADDRLAERLSNGARDLAGRLSREREAAEWIALYDRLLARS